MWRFVCVAFVTISLVVVFGATAFAQGLAPSTLDVASHDQKTGNDMVQVITEKSVREATDKPVHPITKKRTAMATKKPAQPIVKEPAPAIAKDSARTFVGEPVRPMNQPTVSKREQPASHFTFKTPGGKKESAPVISQYYPKQMVYPFGKDRKSV